MIVYVESNFVLEIALLQEEHESCESILSLAESGRLQLVIPAFSIGEPYEVLIRRSRRRAALHERLSSELHELSRSEPYADLVREASAITDLLLRSAEEEKRRLDAVLGLILDVAQIISIESETIRSAIGFQEGLSLSPQDSIVYASVLSHLSSAASTPRCFLNRNSKDFLTPGIQSELARYDCQLIPSFELGLRFITARLR